MTSRHRTGFRRYECIDVGTLSIVVAEAAATSVWVFRRDDRSSELSSSLLLKLGAGWLERASERARTKERTSGKKV